MAIQPAFVKSVFDLKDLPSDGLPEVVLIGRSNVGKSSLINSLAAKKEIAKTSAKPGKTQSLNFYLFPPSYYLVDTPGYGFAHRSKAEQEKWRRLMESYISERTELQAVGIVIDSRHQGLESDVLALEWIASIERRWFILLSKTDKIKQSEISAHEKYIKTEFSGYERMFSVSSERGMGIAALRQYLAALQ
jgi:GTP-binding protein